MDDDSNGPSETTKGWQRRGFGVGFALVGLLVAVGLLAAACGGGSKDPAPATGSSATTATVAPGGKTGAPASSGSSTTQAELVQLAQCMRSHGVPTFPDPTAQEGTFGAMVSSAGINLGSPTVQAALTACKQYTPIQNVTPAQSAAQKAQALRFSQCMRSHGVPNYPDPSSATGAGTGAVHLNLNGTGIDLSSPTVQAAIKACGGLKS